MPNKILIPLQSLVSHFLEPPTNRRAAVGATEGLWRGYSSVCPKGTVCCAPVAVTQETRHAQTLAALQGSPMAHPEPLKDKAQGKCLICRQAGHWAKECPNRDKSPRTACHKCHQLGHWAALCPLDPRASRSSAKPSLTMVQED
ncbi:unnamed protein product [Rangifer tarandus platyrhynchus]|uniref:Uncharacterized protein n=1 Tax=Rangifer tarandus platyrhynchus TaxID=3082113 RepID=A0AC59ZB79_RANTA